MNWIRYLALKFIEQFQKLLAYMELILLYGINISLNWYLSSLRIICVGEIVIYCLTTKLPVKLLSRYLSLDISMIIVTLADSKFTDKFGENTAEALQALSSVEEITGYLSIHTNNCFRDFSFLRFKPRRRVIGTGSSIFVVLCAIFYFIRKWVVVRTRESFYRNLWQF